MRPRATADAARQQRPSHLTETQRRRHSDALRTSTSLTRGTRVTEAVYRHQLRPVLLDGAVAMYRLFGDDKATRDA